MWRTTSALVLAAAALVACSGGSDNSGDDDVDVDACLEEARTAEDTDTCLIGEALDDLGDPDVFAECVEDGGGAECVDEAFGDDGHQEAARPTTSSTEPSVEEQFVAEVEDAVTGEEAGFGRRAAAWVESVCDAIDTLSVMDDPQPGIDLLLDTSFNELDWTEDASATVLHIGVSHFCREHRAAVSDYIARRGITLGY